MLVAINRSPVEFKLMPEALLWLHENNAGGISIPVEDFFNNLERTGPYGYKECLIQWQTHGTGHVFSNDGKFVLRGNPLKRGDPALIQCIQTLVGFVGAPGIDIKLIDIPDDVSFTIELDENNFEFIQEVHRTWP